MASDFLRSWKRSLNAGFLRFAEDEEIKNFDVSQVVLQKGMDARYYFSLGEELINLECEVPMLYPRYFRMHFRNAMVHLLQREIRPDNRHKDVFKEKFKEWWKHNRIMV